YQALKLLLWIHHLARRFVAADIAAHRADYASEAHAILDAPVAPPDFFLIEPPEMAALPPARRLHWFAGLAILLVAFSPARDDTTYRELARRIAVAMSEGAPPADTFRMLDDILGSILGAVEAGFRRALGAGGEVDAIDVAARDRIAGASLRSLIASLG
ncbi:MAG TPA: hypothetical protein VLX92_12020, partial [Kofleriaceae bacterium]|nr:hypothetical protein [Kofleriaceae bacterium]